MRSFKVSFVANQNKLLIKSRVAEDFRRYEELTATHYIKCKPYNCGVTFTYTYHYRYNVHRWGIVVLHCFMVSKHSPNGRHFHADSQELLI